MKHSMTEWIYFFFYNQLYRDVMLETIWKLAFVGKPQDGKSTEDDYQNLRRNLGVQVIESFCEHMEGVDVEKPSNK